MISGITLFREDHNLSYIFLYRLSFYGISHLCDVETKFSRKISTPQNYWDKTIEESGLRREEKG